MLKRVVIFSLILLFIMACSTGFNQNLLRPTKELLNPRLSRLDLQQKTNEYKYAQANSVTTNAMMYTLFERELENICEPFGEVKGYIEPIVTIVESNRNNGFLFLSILTLTIPNWLGMPLYLQKYQLEVEFEITDLSGNRVLKKTYYHKRKKFTGLYYNWKLSDDEQLLRVFRKMIKEFKQDLRKDVTKINNQLK